MPVSASAWSRSSPTFERITGSGRPIALTHERVLAPAIASFGLWIGERAMQRIVQLVERRVVAGIFEPLRIAERDRVAGEAHRLVLDVAFERRRRVAERLAANGHRQRVILAARRGTRIVGETHAVFEQ